MRRGIQAGVALLRQHTGVSEPIASAMACSASLSSLYLPIESRLAPCASRAFSALPQPQLPEDARDEFEPARRQHAPSSTSRDAWRDSLPTAAQVAARLRSGAGASCSSTKPAAASLQEQPQQQGEEEESALDWREVVARARLQEQAPGSTLTDTFGRRHTYLRVSLTERCNLRCLYCMPEDGVDLTPHAGLLSTDEVERLARLFAAEGVTKIRLTGGEPTLRPDLEDIVRRLAAIPGVQDVALTTNGLTLAKKLPALRSAGLSLLNISLDTLRPDRFEAMTRRRGHSRVLDSIHAAVDLGYDPVKVNVVVMKGVNDDELADFVALTRHQPVNVRFIEYMPFDGNVWSSTKLMPYSDMVAAVQQRYGTPLERCVDPLGEVAKNFRVPGHRGTVSFITSMTSAFCGDCNRLRLMADGNLKVCLFGANEVSLKAAIREGASDGDLRAVVSAAVDRKKAAHAGMFELARTKNRAMVKIGG